MKSLKIRWLLPYIILLCTSLFVSVLFGYYMASRTMYNNLSNSEQQKLSVKVDDFYEKYNNSYVKFGVLSNNEILTAPIDLGNTASAVQYTEEIVNQIKPFIFVNSEFEAVFLINESWIIGASKNNRYIDERKNLVDVALSEEAIRNLLSPNIMGIGNVYKENMLITRLSDNSYLVAVLDFDVYFASDKGEIEVQNLQREVIYSKAPEHLPFKVDEEVFGQYEYNSCYDYVADDYLYTYLKDYKNNLFLIRYPTNKLDNQLNKILVTLIMISVITSIAGILFAIFYIGTIVNPLNRFIAMFNSLTDVQGKNAKNKYTTKLEGKRKITVSLRIFYLTVLVPFLIVNSFMLITLRDNVRDNIISSQKEMIEEWVQRIDNDIKNYQDVLRFVSIDKDIQDILIQNKDYSSDAVNLALIKKGLVSNGSIYSEVKAENGEVLFSNRPLRLNHDDMQLHGTRGYMMGNPTIEYSVEVDDNESFITLQKSVRRVSRGDKGEFFDEIGYITISMDGFIENNFYVEGSFPINQLTVKDVEGDFLYTFESEPEVETVHVSNTIDSVGLTVDYGFVISTTEFERIMFNFYMFMFVLLSFLLYIVAEFTGSRLIKPLNSLIEQIDEISSYEMHHLIFNEHINEFYLLANSFEKMMARLQDMSEHLMKQERNNSELEQRHMRLLLTSIEAQVSPHFLHNIITSIIFLVKGDQKDDAIKMLLKTSEFFKLSLYGTKSLVRIEEEIAHVQKYICIQQIRFPDRIKFVNDVKESLYDEIIPKFMLQPLFENAIEHGMKTENVLTIHLSADYKDDYLCIYVKDDGIGILAEDVEKILDRMDNINNKESHGLANVHQRIKLIYGESSGVVIGDVKEGTAIMLKLYKGGASDVQNLSC